MNLSTNQLCFSIREKSILSNISLSFSDSCFYGIVGPNGSGKTTLLRLICRLLQPSSGEICIDGQSLASLSEKERAKRISLIPQNYRMNHSFSVEEMVSMGRYPHLESWRGPDEKDRKIVEYAMEKTGLLPFREREVTSLSGGELQRVLLARSLAQDTQILLLDEPISHLDIFYQLDLLEQVNALCRDESRTALCVIHDLNLALRYCDQIILLKEGSVFSQGESKKVITPENIFNVYGVKSRIIETENQAAIIY